jgi:Protein of unknown function (DUF1217)
MLVSGMNYSLLLGGSNATTSLLGGVPAAGSAPALDPLTALKLAQTNETVDVAKEAKDPVVARDIALFKQGIANAKDITTALQNPNVLKVLLTANGLGDQAGFTALAQKALLSDPSDPNSLANKLNGTNAAWLAAAKTYDFAQNGLAVLQDPKVQATIASGYAEVKWRESLDKANPGLSNAMQFQSQAASITKVDQILGNPVYRDVVLTALNIPLEIAYQSLPAQENAISSKLDITKLQDPHFVQTLTQRYLLNKAQGALDTATSSSPDLLTLAAQATGTLV